MSQTKASGGTPARTVTPSHLTLDEQLSRCLHEHGELLRLLSRSIISLGKQCKDTHASDLLANVSDRLDDEIERIETLLDLLDPSTHSKEVAAA